jgi:hypothetical protein
MAYSYGNTYFVYVPSPIIHYLWLA